MKSNTHLSKAQVHEVLSSEAHADITVSGKEFLSNLNLDKYNNTSKSKKRANWRAIKNWLGKYRPLSESSNLERIRGYLEAFHHLCEIEAWEESRSLLDLPLSSPLHETLVQHLHTWNYYQQEITLYTRLLDHCDSITSSFYMNQLGFIYMILGQEERALTFFKRSLITSQREGSVQWQGLPLIGIGLIHSDSADLNKTISTLDKSLVLAQSTKNLTMEALILGVIGVTYLGIQNQDRANE
ncbi:hypothetical protein [Leptothoe spongobia]|uniref:Tetratricopeptide repeat protein n=1 Tax=Leptothoe spongobia TAU-MAC 1115 TaxID=1967444 RepID=A0A947DLU9_9CYAN|nr:hypothetical protein [Leptothoe spongobia]MBT9317969.1 hypothetical protein [Leptothoe spongobia TAU-MAC 1115]